MNKVLTKAAKILSVELYPLFIPTYGIALFCYAYSVAHPLPTVWTTVAVAGTFLLTCLIPLTAIMILMRRGEVTNFHIDNARERTVPYLYSAFGFACWAYLMIAILHAPVYIGFISIGATAAIGLVALINRWWKISAHLTGMGGLVGGLLCYCLGVGAMPSAWMLCLCLGLSLLLMYARLYLNAHTPAQVCAGWLLGLVCTFIPYCVYSYAA